ncbi:hypothetical protein MNEG_8347 [Monoraphidium neglectum]|uniref:Non-canonical E2 ubiquitin-conjugating enzyme C-terminal domain-containing protein n=1 Tax=Monoraphidium neglectum TaxID=145388 RepID=A0A0D2KWF5_9CHLO|nr:hypothetical protein MNEG_8347 [Monoraphidium neglectum]KIY99618.1 hypothetical protein MNEG_8347 [Monoraphidium neglectum]|eukprot:XP_013898638.1 hypothetical protein MNEG_8347 [Monoraphidium neglectum]
MQEPAAKAVDLEETTLQDERMLRMKAEADAADRAQRLRVYAEQLAEFAADKSSSADALLQQAAALSESLQLLLAQDPSANGGGVGGGAAPAPPAPAAAIVEQMQRLRLQLEQAALEARHFADQQRADAERSKRSSQQAELMAVDSDIESKRLKEDDAGAPSSSSRRSSADGSAGDANGGDGGPAAAAAAGAGAGLQPRSSLEQAAAAAALAGVGVGGAGAGMRERCRFIPLRLKLDERRLLRLLEAALNVSEYTDKVDVLTWRSKSARVTAQIRDLCAILSGLVVAQDYKRGQQLVADREFGDNAEFFQDVFEIGRRYKVMNPDKMRGEYGKLMYL